MSGWNGYYQNWNDYLINTQQIKRTSNKIETINDFLTGTNYINILNATDIDSYNIKVSGMKLGNNIYYYYYPSPESIERESFHITEDGVYTLPRTYTPVNTSTDNPQVGFWGNLSKGVVIEQLPLYPGALVGDGIDDYGVTQEAFNEEMSTVLLHYRRLVEVPNKWGYYTDGVNQNRLVTAYYQNSPYFYSNLIEKHNDGNIFIGESLQVIVGDTNLHLMEKLSNAERGKVAIYRLIFIREKLDDTQVEFLRQKVEMEYREWCKKNGYDYAINQLME